MLSIITPVYNGEKYIINCIDSVLNSGLVDYELIVINDGSTDGTKRILDSFSKDHKNIIVIHTENHGQGMARNSGMKVARGEYIAFLDVDDTLEKEGLSYLYNLAIDKGYDIVSGTYYRKDNHSKELVGSDFSEGIISRNGHCDEIQRYNMMKTQSIFGYMWNKIYKKDFLYNNNLWLDDTREVYMEDTSFNIRVFGKDPLYYHLNCPVYCYNIQDLSTTRKYEPEIAAKNVKMLEKLYDNLKSENDLSKSMDLLIPLTIRSFCWSIVRNNSYEGNSYKKKLKIIRIFMENPTFMELMSLKENKNEIKKLPSFPERIFYGGCIFFIKRKLDGLLALGFTIGNPVMQSYINKNLK